MNVDPLRTHLIAGMSLAQARLAHAIEEELHYFLRLIWDVRPEPFDRQLRLLLSHSRQQCARFTAP